MTTPSSYRYGHYRRSGGDGSSVPPRASAPHGFDSRVRSPLSSPPTSPDFVLPPPMHEDLPDIDLLPPTAGWKSFAAGSYPDHPAEEDETAEDEDDSDNEHHVWKADMMPEEREARRRWISSGRGKKGLRIVIVTENFLPKVDGVTRTLARLLEHLEKEGHSCMLLGPGTGMDQYASHPLVGTLGVPLVVYPGLKLNFLRPKFLRTIKDFQPDVVHFVDPIWLGAQTLIAMELGWAGEDWVSENGPAIGAGIRGPVVASYHTNLATYATLFGMSWLEPIMWRFQRWLYSKTLLTLCPSPSTKDMLEQQSFGSVRLWPRGVDLSQFGPHHRSASIRACWGVGALSAPEAMQHLQDTSKVQYESHGDAAYPGKQVPLPMTPPITLAFGPVLQDDEQVSASNEVSSQETGLPSRVVLLYVGRISWEKNLHLLLAAYRRLSKHLPIGSMMPKLVFVGDGPARIELQTICAKEDFDAVFMGHRSGRDLAECYASADIFAFPSFTETFGQVVLEALASGLPVIGLDADGTRDLVKHQSTGFLLPLPRIASSSASWATVCRSQDTPLFADLADGYAQLLARACSQHIERRHMGKTASTSGIVGYTWWDAMERCVDGYRESMRLSQEAKHEMASTGCPDEAVQITSSGTSPRIGRVSRVLSCRLAHKGAWTDPVHDESATWTRPKRGVLRKLAHDGETIWHLKTLVKILVLLCLFYALYWHNLSKIVLVVKEAISIV